MWKLFNFSKARHNNKKTSPRRTAPRSSSTDQAGDFRAVKVLYARQACDAVKDLHDNVFLCAEAPWLPLSECNNPAECRCRYLRLSDRRSYQRRDSDNGLPGTAVATERRSLRDRRRSTVQIGYLQ